MSDTNRNPRAEEFSLEALRQGDKAEFARMVEAHYQLIYRLGLKMLGNSQDAEDILQETFIKAYRHIQDFNGRSSLATWLYRIATNEALMFLRRRRPDSTSVDKPFETDEGDQIPVEMVDWCCLPEREMMSTEARANLDRAIGTLTPNLRAVFVLRDIEGLSTRETAQVLDISEMAVKTRLSRARMALRDELSGYYRERLLEGKRA
jgi:RNA polymerase sigma-70 factor (ECF subfamily)